MEQKPTTDSTSNFSEFESDDWRGNWNHREADLGKEPPLEIVADDMMPRLDNNDVWLYQKHLAQFIERNCPGTMNQRFQAMLRVLCARARIAYRLEKESGIYIGK